MTERLNQTQLQGYLDSLGVRHFSAWELLVQRRTGEVPSFPAGYVSHIAPTVLAADFIRETCGFPIACRSGFRTEAYNRSVGGSLTSEHLSFKAMDLQPVGALPARVERMREVAELVVAHLRLMGLDIRLLNYDTFVHIDVDAAPAKPRTGPRLDFRTEGI